MPAILVDTDNPSDFLDQVDLATEIESIAGDFPCCPALFLPSWCQLQPSERFLDIVFRDIDTQQGTAVCLPQDNRFRCGRQRSSRHHEFFTVAASQFLDKLRCTLRGREDAQRVSAAFKSMT